MYNVAHGQLEFIKSKADNRLKIFLRSYNVVTVISTGLTVPKSSSLLMLCIILGNLDL